MAQAPLLSFRQGVSLVDAAEGQVTLEVRSGKATLTGLTPGLLAALQTLASAGASEDDLSQRVRETDGVSALAPLYYYLQRFNTLGLLCYTVVAHGRPLATVVPMTGDFRPGLRPIGPKTRFCLSRFAYCRRDGDALVLESPLSPARTVLPGPTGAALVASLAQPRSIQDLCARVDGVAEETAEALVSLLLDAGVAAEVAEDDTLPEDNSPTLAQWEFHDLLFHFRSRWGRHDYPCGSYFPFLGKVPPLPAIKPQVTNDAIALYRPDLDRLAREDLPFSRVAEARRSIREYGDSPITAEQLGEFLYRVARVRPGDAPDPPRGVHDQYQISNRPYPSGGAVYELEVYATLNICAGIPSGIYHYDPASHQLRKIAEPNAQFGALLRDAQRAGGLSCEPQVLITLASRFQRVSWKYSGMAYALTLKNVGVLYQSMYLVATAMGLAPCALGTGNAARFAEAVGTDELTESSVGEFLLGSTRPADRLTGGEARHD